MQPSEKQQVEELPQQAIAEGQPLYEFGVGPSPAVSSNPLTQIPLAEAVQRGLIYPPPPSFYENMPDIVPQIVTRPAMVPPRTVASPLIPVAPPKPVKNAKWWIAGVVILLLLISTVGSIITLRGFFSLNTATMQQIAGSTSLVQDYYNRLEAQNYSDAYLDLTLSGPKQLSSTAYAQQARERDIQVGTLLDYAITDTNVNNDPSNPNLLPNLSQLIVTLEITRTRQHYTATLGLQQGTDNQWKITSFDTI